MDVYPGYGCAFRLCSAVDLRAFNNTNAKCLPCIAFSPRFLVPRFLALSRNPLYTTPSTVRTIHTVRSMAWGSRSEEPTPPQELLDKPVLQKKLPAKLQQLVDREEEFYDDLYSG